MSPTCDHSPSAGAAGSSWIDLMGPALQMTWKRCIGQYLLCHCLSNGRIFGHWNSFLINRYFGLSYSTWLDFCLSSCFMVLEMPLMPSQGEGEGTVSVLPVPSCQHQDVCGTSCSLGLLGLLWIFQETAFAAQSQVGSEQYKHTCASAIFGSCL